MIAVGHTAVGALTGLAIYQLLPSASPLLELSAAGCAGLASHYLTDLIPHGHFFLSEENYRRNITLTIIFDLILGGLIFTLLAYLNFGLTLPFFSIFIAMGSSHIPDAVYNLYYLKLLPHKGLLKWENQFHLNTHWHGKLENGLPLTLIDLWQVVIILLAAWLVS